jgi:hypothetical protein
VNLKKRVLFGVLLVFFNLAAWQKDGVPIATGRTGQSEPRVVSLDTDFVVVYRTPLQPMTDELHTIRVDGKTGKVKWDVLVSEDTTLGYRAHQVIVTKDGMIWVTFERLRGWPPVIGLQKLDNNGDRLLGKDGIDISSNTQEKHSPQLCLDGSGEGCYITWDDYRSGNADVWAARVTPQGQVAWEAPVCSLVATQGAAVAVRSDDGSLILWQDSREGTPGLYGQRIVADTFQWGSNGKLIVPFPSTFSLSRVKALQGGYFFPYAVTDMHGGAIFYYSGIYGKVDTLGNLLWHLDAPYSYHFISDGGSGAKGCRGNWTWFDDPYAKVYAIRLDSIGGLAWGDSFVVWTSPYYDTSGNQTYPTVAVAPDKGCVLTWCAGPSVGSKYQLFITRLDSLGQKVWTPDVVEVTALPYDKNHPYVMARLDGNFIVVWEDSRNGNWDLYAALVDSSGRVGIQENRLKQKPPSIVLCPNTPNPFSGSTNIRYQLPSSGYMVLRIQNVLGQTVRILSEGYRHAGDYAVKWDARNWRGERLPDGIYFYELRLKNENGELCEIRKTVLINNN